VKVKVFAIEACGMCLICETSDIDLFLVSADTGGAVTVCERCVDVVKVICRWLGIEFEEHSFEELVKMLHTEG